MNKQLSEKLKGLGFHLHGSPHPHLARLAAWVTPLLCSPHIPGQCAPVPLGGAVQWLVLKGECPVQGSRPARCSV